MELLSLEGAYQYGTLVRAKELLLQGGVLAVPTDTVYGLIADATNDTAIKKIYAIKERSVEKALPVFVRDVLMARRYAYVSDVKACFLERIWPGNVTIVFHHKEKLPESLTGGLDTIGIRIPNHPFLLELLSQYEYPLAQTSANISGEAPAVHFGDVERCFGEREMRPDAAIDGGDARGTASAILAFTHSDLRIIRTGMMSKEELDRILGALYTE